MTYLTDIIQLLQHYPSLAFVLLVFISLLIGSFLNLVIYRYPIMLFKEWHSECQEFLAEYKPVETPQRFNLCLPNSHCPACNTPLKIHHNIPLLSYLYLRGRCAYCKTFIAWQYPLIESIALVLGVIVGWRYGLSWETVVLLLLTFALIANAAIDVKHQILPDNITLPLLWFGLLLNTHHFFVTPVDAILGAFFGYTTLWTIASSYKLLTGRLGMAHGDFKLFALFGAWFGWQVLPLIILIASLAAVIVGLALIKITHITRHTPIPFGPYLALGGWLVGVFQLAII